VNFFDAIQESAFDIVTNTMGYDASWNNYTSQVLFNSPSEKQAIQDVEFDPTAFKMEYREGVFDGLKESVDEGNNETIDINGITYYVIEVKKKFDGKTFIATLREK
jgi:hypothetical protein